MIFRAGTREIKWARELPGDLRSVRVLQAACGAGIYKELAAAPAAANALAARLALDADMVERILIVSAALGLAARCPDGWRLTDRGRVSLDPASPMYQGNWLAHSANLWCLWNDLPRRLRGDTRTSAPAGACDGERPWSHRDFILAMHNLAMAGRGAEVAELLDLSDRHRLIDIGGGPGSYSVALCERYPHMRATVFDLPETIAITREVVGRLGMTARIDTVAGDWDRDEFGRGFDVGLMSNILHGPGSQAAMKLAKAHRALVPGGLLIIQEFLLNASRTGPLQAALFNLQIGTYSIPELMALIECAGFEITREEYMGEFLGTTLLAARRH